LNRTGCGQHSMQHVTLAISDQHHESRHQQKQETHASKACRSKMRSPWCDRHSPSTSFGFLFLPLVLLLLCVCMQPPAGSVALPGAGGLAPISVAGTAMAHAPVPGVLPGMVPAGGVPGSKVVVLQVRGGSCWAPQGCYSTRVPGAAMYMALHTTQGALRNHTFHYGRSILRGETITDVQGVSTGTKPGTGQGSTGSHNIQGVTISDGIGGCGLWSPGAVRREGAVSSWYY
jgi:hypothetical protein